MHLCWSGLPRHGDEGHPGWDVSSWLSIYTVGPVSLDFGLKEGTRGDHAQGTLLSSQPWWTTKVFTSFGEAPILRRLGA